MVVRTTPCTRGKTKCEILKFYLLVLKYSLANFLPSTSFESPAWGSQPPIENKNFEFLFLLFSKYLFFQPLIMSTILWCHTTINKNNSKFINIFPGRHSWFSRTSSISAENTRRPCQPGGGRWHRISAIIESDGGMSLYWYSWEIKRDGAPHIKCQVVSVLLSAVPHIYGRAEQRAGGRGRQGWSCNSVQTPDTRLPSPLVTHCICLQRLLILSCFTSSSSRGIFNPDKMLDVFVRVFEKYKARCRVLELRRAAVPRQPSRCD